MFSIEQTDSDQEVESSNVKSQHICQKSSRETSVQHKRENERSNLLDDCQDKTNETPQEVFGDKHTYSNKKMENKLLKTSCSQKLKNEISLKSKREEGSSNVPDYCSDESKDIAVAELITDTNQDVFGDDHTDSDKEVEINLKKAQCSQRLSREISVQNEREKESSNVLDDLIDESKNVAAIRTLSKVPQDVFGNEERDYDEEGERKHMKTMHSLQTSCRELSLRNQSEKEGSDQQDDCTVENNAVTVVSQIAKTPKEPLGSEEVGGKYVKTRDSSQNLNKEADEQNTEEKESLTLLDNSSNGTSDENHDVAVVEMITKTPQEVFGDEHTDSNEIMESEHMKTPSNSKSSSEICMQNKRETESSQSSRGLFR